jgi:hypothetical protein
MAGLPAQIRTADICQTGVPCRSLLTETFFQNPLFPDYSWMQYLFPIVPVQIPPVLVQFLQKLAG